MSLNGRIIIKDESENLLKEITWNTLFIGTTTPQCARTSSLSRLTIILRHFTLGRPPLEE